MQVIHYRNDVRRSGVDGRALVSTAKRLLCAMEESGALSLTLIGDEAIRALNRDYRGKDTPTDVLSFPMDGPGTSAAGERLLGWGISSEGSRSPFSVASDPPVRELRGTAEEEWDIFLPAYCLHFLKQALLFFRVCVGVGGHNPNAIQLDVWILRSDI